MTVPDIIVASTMLQCALFRVGEGSIMAQQRLGIIMNGVTGRMGMNQHLIRSIVAIREQGGVALKNGDRVMPDPILVGRSAAKVETLAKAHGIARWTTDLDAALKDKKDTLFFDAATTQLRAGLLQKAMKAGKDIYCEKPVADTLKDALDLVRAAKKTGVKHGVVQDKLFLPGLLKLKVLIDSGFFGRILAVRGEFGYWVFEGDWQPAQRPSWNYKKAEGGGIILDMVCHWRYVLDNLFGDVESVTCLGATHIPRRWDENGKAYINDVDDAAYATFQLKGGAIAHINMSWCTRVRQHPPAGVESGRTAADQVLRNLVGGSGARRLRQRLQGRMGNVHPAPLRGCSVQMDAPGGRQGPATGGSGPQKLEGAALDRHPALEGVSAKPRERAVQGRLRKRLTAAA
jgi:predicted dehydrogenase